MNKKSITRKLIMSISTAAMTAICLGTTTYAWFSQNRNVWVENTDLYVDSYDGLLISLDGKNFSQDITSDQLKMYVTNTTSEEAARDAYKRINLIGTSMKQDAQGEIEKEDDSILFEHDVVNHTDNKYVNTVKLYDQIDDSLVAYLIIETENNEIKSFKAYDSDDTELEIDDSNDDEYILMKGPDTVCVITGLEVDGYVRESMTVNVSVDRTLKYVVTYVDNGYSHDQELSKANENYLKFDLYFRVISDNNSGGNHDEFDLKFTEETYLESKEIAKAIAANTFDAKKYDEESKELIDHKYLAGDEIEFDVANAMRIAVDSKDGLNIFEVTNEYDLGSVAIEGATDEKNDKEKNAMYNYYNSIHPNYAFTKASENGKRFVTNDKFTDVSLGKFTYNEEKGEYNDLKTTVYIWLEGWDADYFLGAPIESRMLNVKLDFKYKDEV